MKKIFKLLIAFFVGPLCLWGIGLLFCFSLVGCNAKKVTVTFESNGGTLIESVQVEVGSTITLPNEPTYEGYKFQYWCLDEELTKKFNENAEISENTTLYAKWSKNWDGTTPVTDSLKLEVDYTDKDFYEDGIGVATVVQYVDGDTTIFRTSNGHKVTIRYLGIDTPESTYTVEPWGFAAANFTKDALKNAKTIVLQTDSGIPGKDCLDTTGKRSLAWVWVDGRLLNLDIVENGLANAKAQDTSYASLFTQAIKPLVLAKVKIYGEKDSNYDYSKVYTEMTVKDIIEKYGTADSITNELDKGKRVRVSGTIVRSLGATSAYLQQLYSDPVTGEIECYGIYLYGGFTQNNKLKQGYSVIVSGTIGYYNGSLQITDVSSANVKVQSFYDQDKILVNEVDDLKGYLSDSSHIGNIIKFDSPITIISTYDAEETTAFSLRATYTDAEGHTQNLSIRIDKNALIKDEEGNRVSTGDYFVGKTFASLTAIVAYYDPTQDNVHNGYIQLMLVNTNDFEFAK